MQRLSHGPQLRERDLLLPCDINLGSGGTRDCRRHQEAKLHKHSEKNGMGVRPLQSYFGSLSEESVILTEILFAYFLGEYNSAIQL